MRKRYLACVLVLSVPFMIAGCNERKQVQIPDYPGAKVDQEHEAQFAGMSFGKLRRVVTSDSFDEVLAFYRERLGSYDPEIVSYALEDGHQAAITISDDDGNGTTVAVQEFRDEGLVAITFMSVGF